MNRTLTVLLLALSLTGCGVRTYTHDRFDANGRLVEHFGVTIIENAYDAKADSANLKLPDGTTLDLNSPSGQVDPNAMAAIQGVAQAVVTAAMAAAKFIGVP
jgi:hypothetical protein